MNVLTFDIEEWYLEKNSFGDHQDRYKEFDSYLSAILDVLDQQGYKGTFFCVGGMAREFPDVVKRIHQKGHEIGCHSDQHVWLTHLSPDECFEDTKNAIDSLEQCIGQKVKSYRAPAFSIGESNKWAVEILAECGIKRDASIFPSVRDFGGFEQFIYKKPTRLQCNKRSMKEFPICTTKLLGREIAYSGGGYFRFFPLGFVKRELSMTDYSMTYFHIADLLPRSSGVMEKEEYERYFKEPGTLKNRYMRYVKSNIGKRTAFKKLVKLLKSMSFVNLEQADLMTDWEQQPSLIL